LASEIFRDRLERVKKLTGIKPARLQEEIEYLTGLIATAEAREIEEARLNAEKEAAWQANLARLTVEHAKQREDQAKRAAEQKAADHEAFCERVIAGMEANQVAEQLDRHPKYAEPPPFVPVDWGLLENQYMDWRSYTHDQWRFMALVLMGPERIRSYQSRRVSAKRKNINEGYLDCLKGLRDCFRVIIRDGRLRRAQFECQFDGGLLHITHQQLQDKWGDMATNHIRKMTLKRANEVGLITRKYHYRRNTDGTIAGRDLYLEWSEERFQWLVTRADELIEEGIDTVASRRRTNQRRREGGTGRAKLALPPRSSDTAKMVIARIKETAGKDAESGTNDAQENTVSVRIASHEGSASVSACPSTVQPNGVQTPDNTSLYINVDDVSPGDVGMSPVLPPVNEKPHTNHRGGDWVEDFSFVVSGIQDSPQPTDFDTVQMCSGSQSVQTGGAVGTAPAPLPVKTPAPPPRNPATPQNLALRPPSTRTGTTGSARLDRSCHEGSPTDQARTVGGIAPADGGSPNPPPAPCNAAQSLPEAESQPLEWRKFNTGHLPGEKVLLSTGPASYDAEAFIWVKPTDDPLKLNRYEFCPETIRILKLLQDNDEQQMSEAGGQLPRHCFYPEAYTFEAAKWMDQCVRFRRPAMSVEYVQDWLDVRNDRKGYRDHTESWEFNITELIVLIKNWEQIHILTQRAVREWQMEQTSNPRIATPGQRLDYARHFIAQFSTWSREIQELQYDKFFEFKEMFRSMRAAHYVQHEQYYNLETGREHCNLE
jgi:hypothetical protein